MAASNAVAIYREGGMKCTCFSYALQSWWECCLMHTPAIYIPAWAHTPIAHVIYGLIYPQNFSKRGKQANYGVDITSSPFGSACHKYNTCVPPRGNHVVCVKKNYNVYTSLFDLKLLLIVSNGLIKLHLCQTINLASCPEDNACRWGHWWCGELYSTGVVRHRG